MGSTEFAKGTWVGLELANEFKGKHNGTVEGTKYFAVNVKGQGVMVKAEKIKKRVCSRRLFAKLRSYNRFYSVPIQVASKKGKSGKKAKVKKGAVATGKA